MAIGHVARPNPLWRIADTAAGPADAAPGNAAGIEALAIFPGPNAYVTPSWYPAKAETGMVVPTWNYEVVQLRGTLTARDDRAWVLDVVRRLTDRFEVPRRTPWSIDDAPGDYIDTMAAAIVGVELQITAVEAKRKLSQNQPPEAVLAVIEGLGAGTATERLVASRTPQPRPHG